MLCYVKMYLKEVNDLAKIVKERLVSIAQLEPTYRDMVDEIVAMSNGKYKSKADYFRQRIEEDYKSC